MALNKNTKQNILIYALCIIAVLSIIVYFFCDEDTQSLMKQSQDIKDLKKRNENLLEQHEKNLQAINEKYGL